MPNTTSRRAATGASALAALLSLGPVMRAHAQSPATPANAAANVPSAPDHPLPVRTAAERDRAAIQALVEGVARDADLRLWDRLGAAFAERVAFDYGTPETLSGADIVARWRPLLGGFDGTRHELRDVRVTVDGDRATSTSRFHATHVLRGALGGDTWVLDGRYEHEATRTPAGWKLTRMRMTPDKSTGNATLAEQTTAVFEDVVRTNAYGVFWSMKYELPAMLRNAPWGAYGTRGVIVNTASVSGHVGFAGIGPYAVSKHAVVGLTRCAALDYGARGIRVNAIAPGGVDTPMRHRATAAGGYTGPQPAPMPNVPHCVNTTDEMADVVLFLAADTGTSIQGVGVDVTGGMLSGAYLPSPNA